MHNFEPVLYIRENFAGMKKLLSVLHEGPEKKAAAEQV